MVSSFGVWVVNQGGQGTSQRCRTQQPDDILTATLRVRTFGGRQNGGLRDILVS